MNMNKLFSACVAFAMTATSAFASTTNLNQYYSSMHPSTSNAIKNLLHPPVDITIINATSDYIYVVVPNSPINDYISPGYNDHIHNFDPNIYSTYLVVQDPYRNTFYSNTVCRTAILTVYGHPGNYRQNLDTDLCN